MVGNLSHYVKEIVKEIVVQWMKVEQDIYKKHSKEEAQQKEDWHREHLQQLIYIKCQQREITEILLACDMEAENASDGEAW